jgi:type I restriction enzyme R subunit
MTEDELEQACLSWLQELDWAYAHGPELLPEEPGRNAEREDERQVLLLERLRTQLHEINEHLPEDAIEQAIKRLASAAGPNLTQTNLAVHRMLTEGVDVSYQDASGATRHGKCSLIAWDTLELNEFLAVNQFTVRQGQHTRRPDIVLFVNGIPLVVIELKNPTDPQATMKKAWNQLQTYHQQIPALHQYAALEVVSDGLEAKYGTHSAGLQHFSRWPTLDGSTKIPVGAAELEVLVRGFLDPATLLDVIRNFIVFEGSRGDPIKKVAKYHQVFAVNRAVRSTLAAVDGDRRAGVVWHTQGAGKSLEMVFYAGRIARHPDMQNPTLVVLTDRQDLDNQLFGTFGDCEQLLRQVPRQANDRNELKDLLSVPSGGIVFTTIQKFFPENRGEAYPMLSDRRNIVVIADEAHRSQYDFIDGFARHMRDALPHAVFGEYVDIYDIKQAVDDGATVPLSYEGRLAKISLDETSLPKLDDDFDQITEAVEDKEQEQLKRKWAAVEALVGSPERLELVAQDLVNHFEGRQAAISGKAMVVVMSRRIAIDLYQAIIKLRPDWHEDDDAEGVVKVIMTGSASDPVDWQDHIRNKRRREDLAIRFKDPGSDFKIVIVRDMWLTGFDAPCLHTMYCDKPMSGHNLMQAIARVNRVFKDKPGGLVVDYIGIAQNLKEAVATYTESGGKGDPYIDVSQAVAVMQEKLDVLRDLMHEFDWSAWTDADVTVKLGLLKPAADFVLGLEDGKKRFFKLVTDLSKAFALCASTDEAIRVRDDIGFFQAVRAQIIKASPPSLRADEDLNTAIKQLVDEAVQPDEVIDIFSEAGIGKPDISILSDDFLEDLKGMDHKNLALETLKRLLQAEITQTRKKNIVQAKSFSERLQEAVLRYQNRSIEAAQVMEELIELAKKMRAASQRGESLGLAEDELAFYDALADNPSALKMGDDTLKQIARELVQSVRKSVTVDWTIRDSAQAHMRRVVKRLLRKHGYPPDAQPDAVRLVLEQASTMGDFVADGATGEP